MMLKKLGLKVILPLLIAAGLLVAVIWVDARASKREALAAELYPPLGQFLTVNGLQIHAHVLGSGPDLVLIHGASGNTRDFSFGMMEQLSTRYRVIAFDRPGLGWSERLPKGQDGLLEQAEVLQQAALALGAEKPLVLGQSYGGAVALACKPSQTPQ